MNLPSVGTELTREEDAILRMMDILTDVRAGVPGICDTPMFASYEFAADFALVVEAAASKAAGTTAFQTAYERIISVRENVESAESAYLRRFGWTLTCNTPGSFWLWRRDFAGEDAERHKRWKERGPGPYGWPSEPKAYGVIYAGRELAVSMTLSDLDPRPFSESDDE